jgi:tetratricopeptide (TPR) repeat protein
MPKRPFTLTAVAVIAIIGLETAWAADTITIKIPRHTQSSVVQRLNREGVTAVEKHDYAKASDLFLKAYLYDPADPFTLNNLGYISELQGQMDRADKFYKLAAEQGCAANIDSSNVKHLQGMPMNTALAGLKEAPMRVNRINVDAMRLLSENRGREAAALLEQARALDPQNPYTLNNLGVANESLGDYDRALRFYSAAANSGFGDTIVIAGDRAWQGKTVIEMAAANYRRLEKRQAAGNAASQADLLNRRGVLAENQNDWSTAKRDFLKAYTLDPSNAFSLNNRGYVAEMDGDLESAQFFYEKALRAGGADVRVGLATENSAEGKPLFRVTTGSDQKVGAALDIYSRERRQPSAPVELTPRDNAPSGGTIASPEQQSSPGALPPPAAPKMPQ